MKLDLNVAISILNNAEIQINIIPHQFLKEGLSSNEKIKFEDNVKQLSEYLLEKYKDTFLKELRAKKVLEDSKQNQLFDNLNT